MRRELDEQIFELTRWKLKVGLGAVKKDARLIITAAEEESKLWQELMVKELEARVVAATTAAAALAGAALPPRKITAEDNVIISEVASGQG